MCTKANELETQTTPCCSFLSFKEIRTELGSNAVHPKRSISSTCRIELLHGYFQYFLFHRLNLYSLLEIVLFCCRNFTETTIPCAKSCASEENCDVFESNKITSECRLFEAYDKKFIIVDETQPTSELKTYKEGKYILNQLAYWRTF